MVPWSARLYRKQEIRDSIVHPGKNYFLQMRKYILLGKERIYCLYFVDFLHLLVGIFYIYYSDNLIFL